MWKHNVKRRYDITSWCGRHKLHFLDASKKRHTGTQTPEEINLVHSTNADRGGTVVKGAVLQIGRSLVRSQLVIFIDIKSFRTHYGPGVDSASNRNEYQEHFLGVKTGRCVRLTTLPPSCVVVTKSAYLNFLEPSGPLQTCNGLLYLDTPLIFKQAPDLEMTSK